MNKIRTTTFKKEINKVELTGFVQNLPEFVRYIPVENGIRPLISFDLKSYRPNSKNLEEGKFDLNTIVLFDEEHILNKIQENSRVRVVGEMQSRNYNRVNRDIDELLTIGVQNYMMITNSLPTEIQPSNTEKQPIVWEKLLDLGLILEIPSDSMFKEEMRKDKTPDSPFMYLVTIDGEITKESQHVTYEVLATEYEILEDDLDLKKGDINKVKLCGRIGKEPNFNVLGEQMNPFVSFAISSESKLIDGKRFFNNVIAWGKNAQYIFEETQLDDIVMIKGRLQSRNYKKVITYRWKTPTGNRKKKDVELDLLTREVSLTYIEKQRERKLKKDEK